MRVLNLKKEEESEASVFSLGSKNNLSHPGGMLLL